MNSTNTGKKTIQSDETLFDIIEFLKEREGAGVTEVANGLDMAKSSVHGHLVTMQNAGYVVKEGTEYRLGLRFLEFGIHVRNQQRVYHLAKPKVEELAQETNERAWCFIEEDGLGYFAYKAEGTHPVHTDVQTGECRPLHYHSGGKAMLAFQSEDRIEEIIDWYGLPGKTEKSITDKEDLLEELKKIRERGYALNEEESIRGLIAIGAPIRNPDGAVHAALSIAGPANRLRGSQCQEEFADLLLGATNEIELNLEYS